MFPIQAYQYKMLGLDVLFQQINTFLREDMTCFSTTHHKPNSCMCSGQFISHLALSATFQGLWHKKESNWAHSPSLGSDTALHRSVLPSHSTTLKHPCVISRTQIGFLHQQNRQGEKLEKEKARQISICHSLPSQNTQTAWARETWQNGWSLQSTT